MPCLYGRVNILTTRLSIKAQDTYVVRWTLKFLFLPRMIHVRASFHALLQSAVGLLSASTQSPRMNISMRSSDLVTSLRQCCSNRYNFSCTMARTLLYGLYCSVSKGARRSYRYGWAAVAIACLRDSFRSSLHQLPLTAFSAIVNHSFMFRAKAS